MADAQSNNSRLRPHHLPQHITQSDNTNVVARRQSEQTKATAAAAAEAVSAWNTSTSPMLTCLHVNHQSPRKTSPHVKRNKRSFSFDDTHDLEHLMQPALLTNDEFLLLQKQDMKSISGTDQEETTPSSLLDEKPITSLEEKTPVGISITYGIMNATIVLPVLLSFGSIIYRDVAFQPYLNVLIKLTVVSGVVHQLCFSTLSSLPFAVGQVQDAGLIFLSSMAASLVQTCRNQQVDDETLLATATVGLSLSTALLGLALVLIGKLKLAQWVQMLP